MNKSTLTHLIEPLLELLCQTDFIIKGYSERKLAKIAGIPCGFLPFEIFTAAGIIPLKIPAAPRPGACSCCNLSIPGNSETYDCVIIPESCPQKSLISETAVPVHEFRFPSGLGGDAPEKLRESINVILSKEGLNPVEKIGPNLLREAAEKYNTLRRIMRAILAKRRSVPGLLSYADIITLYESALVFPPEIAADYAANILAASKNAESGTKLDYIPVMVYSFPAPDGKLLDAMEDHGLLITEDDFCTGARQFDMSINADSLNLSEDILNAFSYHPLCPVIRPPEERFELLYRLIKNYGIEAVIFIAQDFCPGKDAIEFLRVRLMRTGVDTVVANPRDAAEKAKEYAEMARK